jgi:predicted dehydrogenase
MEYRYMPPVAALIEQAQAVTGGIKMLTIREHRFPFLEKVGDWNRFNAKTGGTLVEKCCHFFDLMRVILQDNPVRVMASGGADVNHLSERYDGKTPDIWDNAYVIVDFARGARAMLELCMFAEGARYQEEITAVGPKARIECLVPGPGRFWPAHLGAAPVPQLIVSPRDPKGPHQIEVPVDPALLAAGDHNGSTFYQHDRFANVVRGRGTVERSSRSSVNGTAASLSWPTLPLAQDTVTVVPLTLETVTSSSDAGSSPMMRVNGYDVGQPGVAATVAEVAPDVREPVNVVVTAVDE